MKPVILCLAAIFLTLIIMPVSVIASGIPENLEYELTWAGKVKIGTSSIRTGYNGADLEIVSKVDSAPWSAPFYKVDDLETSKLTRSGKGFGLHQYRMKLHEGTNDWYRVVTLDREGNKKIRFNHLLTGEKTAQKFVKDAWDPVSSLYYLRRLPLTVGKPVYVNVLDKRKLNRIKVSVLRRETVNTPAGEFRTIVISPEMSIDSEGLFYAPGLLTIWLTDDPKKVPVMIEKRIEELFRKGVPNYLEPMIPASVWANAAKVETIRAMLTGGSW